MVYADLGWNDKKTAAAPTRDVIVHGAGEMTEYGIVDFKKTAELNQQSGYQ